ncbi:CAP domain-containing protein [Anaerosolibacter sp.]|uniref:CAP domain-containing protein n=1 Tax=Anaerosolibacter sp. TaxID=1872527 RepID=UPI0039F0A59B
MKKNMILILAMIMVLSACAPTVEPQRRPTVPQQESTNEQQNAETPKQNPNPNGPALETNQSSIFEVGQVRNCRITADTADVKAGAGNNFNTIANLKKDEVTKVLGQVGDWYVVQLDNNQVGAIEGTKAVPVVKEGQNQETPKVQPPQQIKQPQAGQQPDQTTPQRQTGQQPGQTAQQPQQTQRNQVTQNAAPTTPQTTNKLSGQAQQMVDLVNRERTKNGLSALTVDSELARVAGIKSQDMVDKDYFSHYSPTYGSPFDMMKNFGIEYITAGENLAGNSSVEKAHEALMNSSGHRQNILSPDFTHIGIGVRTSGKYGYVYTQLFISK